MGAGKNDDNEADFFMTIGDYFFFCCLRKLRFSLSFWVDFVFTHTKKVPLPQALTNGYFFLQTFSFIFDFERKSFRVKYFLTKKLWHLNYSKKKKEVFAVTKKRK